MSIDIYVSITFGDQLAYLNNLAAGSPQQRMSRDERDPQDAFCARGGAEVLRDRPKRLVRRGKEGRASGDQDRRKAARFGSSARKNAGRTAGRQVIRAEFGS